MQKQHTYWRKVFGIELFKIRYYTQWLIYKLFRIKLPKLKDQKDYWRDRGQVYMDEIINSGYLEREIFFQNMLVAELKRIEFNSFFEAGCGFGWNVKRVKEVFPDKKVMGLDFSISQLEKSKSYMAGFDVPVVNGDNCYMSFKDNAFDVGFSLGVFMNIHPDKIKLALREMTRVCSKYIIHIEYDEDNTTPELREKRALKSNIVSHHYKKLYEELGMNVITFSTYKDFGKLYNEHAKIVKSNLDRWERFEGPEKYIFVVVEV